MSMRSWFARNLFHSPQQVLPTDPVDGAVFARSARRRMAVDDCAAFLTGTLAEYRLEHGQMVLPWEWTNLLAHGDEAALHGELAGSREQPGPPDRRDRVATWRAARSYLVAELLSLAATCGPLADLQRSLLIPLELELAERRDTICWRPNEWLLAVEGVLSERRRRTLHLFPRPPRTPD